MPRKPKLVWSWIKKDKAFIEMMEQYENNDAVESANQKELWREISMRVGLPASYCRRKWTGIKHNYLILKYMIHVGNVTEDMVRKHIKTSKYLDGRLDFLDRYMFKIHEKELSSSARNFFDSTFGVPASTQNDSSVEKCIKVKSFVEVIKDSKQEIGTEPMSILPNINSDESDSSITHFEETFVNSGMDEAKEIYRTDDDSNDGVFVEPAILPDIPISTSIKREFVDLGMDQAINEGYQIHDDLNDVQFVASDMLPNIQIEEADPIGDNVIMNVTNKSILKDILTSTKNEETKSTKPSSDNTCDLALFLVKYANTKIDREEDKDCNLKKYMYDLAEVLCRRLVPEKRKYFLSRVDLIVSEILEET